MATDRSIYPPEIQAQKDEQSEINYIAIARILHDIAKRIGAI
jgi:hypothetical protein